MDQIDWEFWRDGDSIGSRLRVTADVSDWKVSIYIAHAFVTRHTKTGDKQLMSSMTGMVYNLELTYRSFVALGEYTYNTGNDRLYHTRIFYPAGVVPSLKQGRRWTLTTAIRLLRKYWRDKKIDEDPDKVKELRVFINSALDNLGDEKTDEK
jgi:hypothetical protein